MIPAIGYTIREQDGAIFDDPAINGAEITLHGSSDRRRLDGGRLRSAGFDYISVHPLNGGDDCSRDYLDVLKSIADDNGARSVSDRCSPSRTGHRRRTRRRPRQAVQLEATCRRVDAIQSHFGETRFYLDHPFERTTTKAGLTEAEFLASVLRRTGCGWLLDATEVYVTGLNEGIDPFEFVEEVAPAAEQVQMHLSGVAFERGSERFIESASHLIPQPLLDLYEFALDTAEERVSAVFIDRDCRRTDEETRRREVRLVREIAESAAALASAAC